MVIWRPSMHAVWFAPTVRCNPLIIGLSHHRRHVEMVRRPSSFLTKRDHAHLPLLSWMLPYATLASMPRARGAPENRSEPPAEWRAGGHANSALCESVVPRRQVLAG